MILFAWKFVCRYATYFLLISIWYLSLHDIFIDELLFYSNTVYSYILIAYFHAGINSGIKLQKNLVIIGSNRLSKFFIGKTTTQKTLT